ncbi:penicillin-binding protein 2, partial [candidate division KSB1 bacterium]|nr:penicillin-binding protein 2 [candidate division KSB1 bacterium]
LEIFLIVVFSIMLLRFFYLQIYLQDYYHQESEKNRVRTIIIPATRGLIFDHNREVLVDNFPAYSVYGIPYDLQNADSVFTLLSNILSLPVQEIKSKILEPRWGVFQPIKLKRHVDFQTLSAIEELKLQLPGVEYHVEPRRAYPSGVKAPHIFGYLGEISSEELTESSTNGYNPGDIIGKQGLEKAFEDEFRGKNGVYYIEVDAFGRKIRDIMEKGNVPSVPGNHIILTLDKALQIKLEQELEGMKGGGIVLNVKTGEILAITSKPDYDPSFFARPRPLEIWEKLATDQGHPLYHRMLQSFFPPGSTYKLVLALTALQENKVNLDWKITCNGSYTLGTTRFDCWKAGGHGEMDLLNAIEQSCNVYFYQLMLEVPFSAWSRYGKMLGFGKSTGIDLPGENSGLVPDNDFMNRKYGRRGWTKGQLLNLAVGQGDLLVTPIQMAVLAMIIANEGTYYQPHIVKSIQNATSGKEISPEIYPLEITGISRKNFQIVKNGMFRVVHGAHGTGRFLSAAGIPAAGKTGTAENPHGEPHAWFIGFAPYQNPEIAFCIFIENGGAGSAAAVPIARKILTAYFNQSLQ